MRSFLKKSYSALLILLLSFSFTGCSTLLLDLNEGAEETGISVETKTESKIIEDGHYTSKDDVVLYLHTYGKLPENFITKGEAMDLGWESSKGNLWEVTDKMSIGGDRFGNREGLLPDASNRKWFECDIDYEGGYRGEKRIVYSNDGLIYYSADHYTSFKKLY